MFSQIILKKIDILLSNIEIKITKIGDLLF